MRNNFKTCARILLYLTLILILSGVYVFADDEGVKVVATEGQEETVTVNKDVSSKGDAVIVKAEGEGSSAEVTVNGDIESDEGHGAVVSADEGSASLSVNGDIEADEDGIDAKAYNGGSVKVDVEGDVESDEDGGIDAAASDGGSVDITVDGDVTSEEESGLDLKVSNGGSIDVAVTGTVSGKQSGIITNAETPGCDGDVTVTVWKIKVNEKDGKKFVALDYNGKINRKFEKTINYIIKIKDPRYISLPNLKKGKFGYTAHEGDVLLVRVDVPDGYDLDHLYWDEDKELELIRGKDGNYYVEVPLGGGVILSLDLDEEDDGPVVKAAYAGPATGDKEELMLWIAIMLTAFGLFIKTIKCRIACE